MYITGAKFTNFKSFGEEDNYIRIDKKKTAIIGVNESGKSNILELIGRLDFKIPLPQNYVEITNLNAGSREASIDITLQFEQSELSKLNTTDHSETTFHFTIGQIPLIEGNLQNQINGDPCVIDAIGIFEEALNNGDFDLKGNNLQSYRDALNILKNSSQRVIEVNSIDILARSLKSTVDQTKYKNCLENVKQKLNLYYGMLPVIVYRTARDMQEIKTFYTDKDAEKDLTYPNTLLYQLTKASGVEFADMKEAFSTQDNSKRASLRYQINKKIRENVCDRFRYFYNHNDYDLHISFETNRLYIRVITGENCLAISERSNGLKWYFGLFLQLAAQDYENKNIIYVLDEPGVFLHINAQKELIHLFNELSKFKGQVIYSTHLPSMLDMNDLQCIRRVEKDDAGNSHIFQTFYGKGLNNTPRYDTLAPLLQSLGCDLKYIGPINNKYNILTEGPTDQYYLEAGMKILNVPESRIPNIIASNGASTIKNILPILIGWGCECKVLFDYDRAGFAEYHALERKYGNKISDFVCMVSSEPIPINVNDKSIETKTIEDLISESDKQKLQTPYDGTNATKTISALEFREKIIAGEIIADEETVNNYKLLFKRLKITQ